MITTKIQNKRETKKSKISKFTNDMTKTDHTLLKHARTLGTPSVGPSMPGMKSIMGPIQLKGLTIVNSRPFSTPSTVINKTRSQNIHYKY
jgi:hypothetical protein